MINPTTWKIKKIIEFREKGMGGGQVVSILTFYSDNPSLNPADAFSFFMYNCVCQDQK